MFLTLGTDSYTPKQGVNKSCPWLGPRQEQEQEQGAKAPPPVTLSVSVLAKAREKEKKFLR